jgi:hypothetical protein
MDNAIKRLMIGLVATFITIGTIEVIIAWERVEAAKSPLEKILREAIS